MSRKSASRMCRGIIAGSIVLSFGFAASAIAQTTPPLPMIPAPPMPLSTTNSDQEAPLFLSLLDDVILKKQIKIDLRQIGQVNDFIVPCDGTCDAKCCCSLKMTASESELEKACEDADEWAALMTCPCDLKNCGGGCDITIVERESKLLSESLPCMECVGCVDCSPPATDMNPAQNDADVYCQQIAQLLAASLENSNSSVEDKQKAIESAMKLVAQKALESADAKILDLKLQHAKSVQELELKLVRANTYTETLDRLETWMRPIYHNQNRNFQQLKLIAASSNSLHRAVSTWERNMVAAMARVPDPIKTRAWYGLPAEPIEPVDNEVTRLKRELAEMANRIDRIQSSSVKSAGHLEPIYVPDAELQPLMPEVKMLPRYSR